MTTREQLKSVRLGEIRDLVFSSGIARVTRELERVEEDEWFAHDFMNGWLTTSLTLEEAIKFVEGDLRPLDLVWN